MTSRLCLSALALILAACSPVPTYVAEEFQEFVLEAQFKPLAAVRASDISIVVAMPRPRAGFDTNAMVYRDQNYTLDSFARNRWAAPPARMLGPLLVQALDHSGRFSSVFGAPTLGQADWRLDTDDVRLLQEFDGGGSQVRAAFRVTLTDTTTRKVLVSRELETVVPAAEATPAGGVRAANRAVADLLQQVVALCSGQLPVDGINAD